MLTEIGVIFVLILANAFFAAAEIAVVSVRKTRLTQLVKEGHSSAAAVQALRADPERFLAGVQVGITLVSAGAAAFGGASIAVRLEVWLAGFLGHGALSTDLALAIVVVAISFLSIVIGELVPKSLALRAAEPVSLIVGRPIRAFSWLVRPAVWLLTSVSNLLLRPFGDRTTFTESRLSGDELQLLVEEASKTGSVDARAGEIASRALEFGTVKASQVMVPRNRMHGIPVDASAEEVRAILREHMHRRFPVYDGTLDNVLGYVSSQDLLTRLLEQRTLDIRAVLREVHLAPATAPAAGVLRELQKARARLAILVDEHGGVAGLLTTEDLVEELVGELFSEHDRPEELVRREPGGSALVDGHAAVRDVNRALDLDLPQSDDWGTIAGLCAGLAGGIPETGSTVTTSDGTRLEILDASPHVVRLVRIHPPKGT